MGQNSTGKERRLDNFAGQRLNAEQIVCGTGPFNIITDYILNIIKHFPLSFLPTNCKNWPVTVSVFSSIVRLNKWRCNTVWRTSLHCTVLYLTALHCTALNSAVQCRAIQFVGLHCTVLYLTALQCNAVYSAVQCSAIQFEGRSAGNYAVKFLKRFPRNFIASYTFSSKHWKI